MARNRPEPARTTRARVVAEYPYCDESGQVLGWVLRYEPKDFRWKRPGPGGRREGGAPERRPLYRLPEVLSAVAGGELVYVCEGEKDADALAAAGVVATCNPGGAAVGIGAGKWRPEHTAALAGARVVLVADRDGPDAKSPKNGYAGYRHAIRVRDELVAAGASVTVVEAAAGKDAADHLAAGRTVAELAPVTPEDRVPADFLAWLRAGAPASADPAAGDGPAAPAIDLETERRRRGRGGGGEGGGPDEAPAVPGFPVPMSQGSWRYSTGEDGFDRGVYRRADRRDEDDTDRAGWVRVAPLPYVWERLTRREGDGRRAAVDFRLSMDPPGTAGADVAVCDSDEVKTGDWASRLDVALSADDKVARAVATAIRDAGRRFASARETAPRWHAGALELPPTDVGPRGYGETAGDEDAARQAWREIAGIAAGHPKLALTVGVSMGGAFVEPLARQPFVYLMVGGGRLGKTTALTVGGALYGRVDRVPGAGTVVTPWNTSSIGMTGSLGELACLPAFRDELAASGLSPAALETLIFRLTQGASRTVGTRLGGTRTSAAWKAPLLSSGNDGVLGRSTNEGVAARVVEVATPITCNAEDAERAEMLARGHYGWPLRWLTVAGPDPGRFRDAVDRAEADLAVAGGGVARTLGQHCALAVAGAELFDTLTGVPDATRPAALAAARDVLTHLVAELAERGARPGERLVAAVVQAAVSRPHAFPSLAEYMRAVDGIDGSRLAREVEGFTLDSAGNRPQIAVLPIHLEQIAAAAGLADTLPGLRQLRDDGVLIAAGESDGRLTKQIRLPGSHSKPRCYVFRLPDEPDEDTRPPAPPLAAEPPVGPTVEPEPEPGLAAAATTIDEGRDADVEPDFDGRGRLVRAAPAPCEQCGLPVPYRTAGRPLHPYAACIPAAAAAPEPAGATSAPTGDAERHAEPPADPAGVSAGERRYRAAVLDVSRRGRAVRATLTAVALAAEPELVDVPAGAAGFAALAVARDLSDVWVTGRSLGALGLADVPPFTRVGVAHPHSWAETPAGAGVTVRAAGLTPWTALDVAGRQWPVNVGFVAWMGQRSPLRELDGAGLARALAGFLDAVDEPFRHSAAATAGNLLARESGATRPGARVRGRKARLEPCRAVLDGEVPRASRGGWTLAPVGWERAIGDEAALPLVQKYDGNAAYLAAYGTPVGLGEPDRRPAGAGFTPKLAGYHQVDPARLVVPHPLMPAWNDHPEGDGTVWLTTPEYAMLDRLGIAPPILASVVWPDSSRLLDTLAVRLRGARKALMGGRTDPAEMAEFKKSDPVGHATYKLANSLHQIVANYVASPERRADDDRYGKALYRPDWRDMWVSHVRCAHYARMARAGAESGRWPLYVNEDAVAYAAADVDPATALPAGLVYGLAGGQYKSEGTADMARLLARRKRPERGFLAAFEAAQVKAGG